MSERAQKTLKKEVRFSGVGVHSGKVAEIFLLPAEENTGIVFQRYSSEKGRYVNVPANLDHVSSTGRSTSLQKEGVSVITVEHLLAALKACEVDNVVVRVSEEEIPIGDGSSETFVRLIQEAGVRAQEDSVSFRELSRPVFYQSGDIFLAAFPADEFKISYTLHYPHCRMIGTQYRSLVITEEVFRKEIAPCRTFALYNELCFLMEKGLIRGGSLENAVIFKDDGIICGGNLRFTDEPVRHKMLDLIGDLSLVGQPFLAHIVAVGSGHSSNIALAKELVSVLQ
ncbi:UDP-3-O-acyl-N-acetylglucosamine deacetylase [Chlamydiifrater phoenicopteri]|uniref:UDP-3-O-acyl-N-acetylglucosamine deacetylase n=1 Tax=Chlamydiifrater phoenicopteri TaxID=2681469 RepID=UPI001BCAF375|nr:UDP-3-O-acyl-N-acetylglucosamine deacetylase [Chlamydiifrater phoenicopteri]